MARCSGYYGGGELGLMILAQDKRSSRCLHAQSALSPLPVLRGQSPNSAVKRSRITQCGACMAKNKDVDWVNFLSQSKAVTPFCTGLGRLSLLPLLYNWEGSNIMAAATGPGLQHMDSRRSFYTAGIRGCMSGMDTLPAFKPARIGGLLPGYVSTGYKILDENRTLLTRMEEGAPPSTRILLEGHQIDESGMQALMPRSEAIPH